MEYFYFYKSCDVKLIRRLIYDKFPALKSFLSLNQWRYFDLITEINDDVEDLFEDMDTINGNSFLISLVLLGKNKTKKHFKDFIQLVIDKSEEKSKTSQKYVKIHKWTREEAEKTLRLISKQVDKCDSSGLRSRAILFKHSDSALQV